LGSKGGLKECMWGGGRGEKKGGDRGVLKRVTIHTSVCVCVHSSAGATQGICAVWYQARPGGDY
jgi:hypothetical protein